ncbi:hypothetical protein BOTBODRAFT_155572 [Botryobasidium botryosum FD-172 SS1]|uniref:Cytochrome P450 n=1 Tax=Botryobasidium botryosum (strain FD-172 SS1) TaxID=930990 RepID=A0A067MP58_BOTB1|nr:hypothetical protein BOTBODRAFT_155572 [Botryobasidium botryosum FD-172 SS1]
MAFSTIIQLALGAVALYVALDIQHRKRARVSNPQGLPLPPGPVALPFIGCVLHLPLKSSWVLYEKWSKIYGDIIYMKVFDKHMVVLNSIKAANDLLGKRAIYADRMRMEMAGELMGWSNSVTLIHYGDRWRRYRRIIHPAFNSGVVDQYQSSQQRVVVEYLNDLLQAPDSFVQSIRLMSSKLIMWVMYGIRVRDAQDEYVVLSEEAIKQLNEVIPPGAAMVELFPFLRHIPAWVPGAGFQRRAKLGRETARKMADAPLEYVKQQLALGSATPCFATKALQENTYEGAEEDIKHIGASMSAAAGDTTVSTLTSFFLAMALFPEVQKRAQSEIDRVVGTGRLPSFGDRQDLPYIQCLIKELLRWRVVLPIGIGHRLTEDDYYEGYYIPKGALVVANVWGISQDESVYPDPQRFSPERFEGEKNNTLDPFSYTFGLGRRICAGMHFANATLYLNIVSVLATFNISKALDEHGREIEPDLTDEGGIINHPLPFKCRITPRSTAAANLILTAVLHDS